MFAGERTAVGDDQVGGLLDEGPVVGAAERHPGVDAAVAEMAVEGGRAVAVILLEPAQVPEVGADAVGRDGRVLPAGIGVARRGADGGFADGGDGGHVVLDDGPHAQVGGHVAGQGLGLLRGVAAELDDQPAAALGQPVDRGQVEAAGAFVLDEAVVHALQGQRVVARDGGGEVGGLEDVAEAEDGDRARFRLGDHLQAGPEDGDQRRFEPTSALARSRPFSGRRASRP